MWAYDQLEQHWLACMGSMGGGARIVRLACGTVVVHARLKAGLSNFIHFMPCGADRARDAVAGGLAILSAYGRKGLLFAPGETGMEAWLEGQGWQKRHTQVCLIRPLPASDLESVPGVEVREVSGRALARWGNLLTAAYEVEPEAGQLIRTAWISLAAELSEGATVRYYIGYLGGRPAGTGLCWTQGGVSGFYCGAVLPQFRRRGVERSLLVRRLQDAAAEGASLAMLHTEAGSPVERACIGRLGFQIAHSRGVWEYSLERLE